MVKVELHCHLDGAIPPQIFLKFAKEANLVDCKDDEWLQKHIMSENMSLADALKQFDLLTSLLQTKEHLVETTEGLIDMKYDEGVRLLEIRFAPLLHTAMSMEDAVIAVLEGLNKGLEKHPDMVCGIILCMMNIKEMDLNDKTIDLAYKYKDQGVVGVDLAGNEGYITRSEFDPLLEKAHNLGLNITIHAGESQDASYVEHAINHYANRIGHGIHAVQDEKVLQHVIDSKVVLEVSPTSNVLANCVDSIDSHPVRKMFDKGVLININTDDPCLMGIDINHEYTLLKEKFGFTDKELMMTNLNGAKASFCKDKDRIIKQIEEELRA